jgi:hypothetical protein
MDRDVIYDRILGCLAFACMEVNGLELEGTVLVPRRR